MKPRITHTNVTSSLYNDIWIMQKWGAAGFDMHLHVYIY